MSKLISMSLYGDIPMYIDGAYENIRLLKDYYPDYTIRIYCSEPLDIECETIVMGPSFEHSGMFWRFIPIWENHTHILFRDTDSRFNPRETAAVRAWEESDHVAHSMHDHEHHRCYPLFGGMWGIKHDHTGDRIPKIDIPYSVHQPRVADMDWLRGSIWPHIENDTLHHSSVALKWKSLPFPEHTECEGFVGQQHDDKGLVFR